MSNDVRRPRGDQVRVIRMPPALCGRICDELIIPEFTFTRALRIVTHCDAF